MAEGEGDAGRYGRHIGGIITVLWHWNFRGRFGFDRGCKAAQGIPSIWVSRKSVQNEVNANDKSYALAA